MEETRTGEDYTLQESITTITNAIKILENGGKIEGDCITGKQITNSMKNILYTFLLNDENVKKNYTIIYDDEDVIGKIKDIKKSFVYELSKTLNDESIDIEDKTSQIDLIQDLLKQLNNEKNENAIIKVKYNPMGSFYYSFLNWEE